MTTPSPSPGGTPGPREAFAELARIGFDQPLGQVLQQVADLAQASLPRADAISILLIEGEQARSVAVTHPAAATLDERQHHLGFGPCMDAALTGQTVRVPDTADAHAYGEYTAQARRHGVRSSVSVGLPTPQHTVGALNLFTFGDQPLDDDDVALAQTFAGYAAVVLANAAMHTDAVDLARQMGQALESRAIIEQAKGVLVARLRCTPEEAFTHLSKTSQRTRTRLTQVAAALVAAAHQQPST